MRSAFAIVLSTALFTSPALAEGWLSWGDDSCDHEAPRATGIDLDGVDRIVIDAGAGFLKVNGGRRAQRLEAEGTACSSNEDLLDDIQLEVARKGDTIKLKTVFPEWKKAFKGVTMKLDLSVTLPDGIPVEINDGSGEMTVTQVRSLQVSDGSGSMTIEDVGGELRIDDGSGSITLRKIDGDTRINDGSGSIDASLIGGDLDINDGSGSINVTEVRGDVDVNDGSGSMSVTDVRGSVTINDGSGSIDVRRVGGGLHVRDSGSGGLSYKDIEGRIKVPRS
ncbi:MAG: hypothetical protein AAF533_11690 [Acidobacteriota bacterium]